MKIKCFPLLVFCLISTISADICFESSSPLYQANILSHFKSAYSQEAMTRSASHYDCFSQAMLSFITTTYNHPEYSTALAQDASHVSQFLEAAKVYKLDLEAINTGLRLFYTKLKATSFIDDSAAIQVMKALSALGHYMTEEKDITEAATKGYTTPEHTTKVVENIILSKFTETLAQATDETDYTNVISRASQEIAQFVNTSFLQKEDAEMRTRLRQLVKNMGELILQKVMWYPADYTTTWDSVVALADSLHFLVKHNLITHADDLDDLRWSLTYRFSHYLEIYGAHLPYTFLEDIHHSIIAGQSLFLEGEELDEGIIAKRDIVLGALIKAKAQSMATHKGFVLDSFKK